eukprot:CCRYP_014170-RA/>CCRYP_014170-RA protein AED:0.02 eAED:0.02 QI:338/1/1/1/0/0/2/8/101
MDESSSLSFLQKEVGREAGRRACWAGASHCDNLLTTESFVLLGSRRNPSIIVLGRNKPKVVFQFFDQSLVTHDIIIAGGHVNKQQAPMIAKIVTVVRWETE